MTLSVIIPVYNAACYLRECLDSLLSQTLDDMEIICIDDGSTDDSAEILAEYAARDKRISVSRQENSGQGVARNRALALAQGEYVFFMDADDYLARRESLHTLVGEAKQDRLDMLLFDASARIEDQCATSAINPADYVRSRTYHGIWTGADLFVAMCRARDFTVSPCMMISRKNFLQDTGIRFAECKIYEDNVFSIHAILAAQRVSHRKRCEYVRRVHAGSTMTAPLSIENLRGYLVCYADGEELFSRKDLSSAVRKIIEDRNTRYRLQIRKIAKALSYTDDFLASALNEAEYKTLKDLLSRNPIGEAWTATRCCLKDRGVGYTLHRIYEKIRGIDYD